MIGLSLSFCVKDIINGIVDEKDAVIIISATHSRDEFGLNYLIERYRDLYWRKNPAEGERIARKLFAEGRVFEPRAYNGDTVNIADGHWLISADRELKKYRWGR